MKTAGFGAPDSATGGWHWQCAQKISCTIATARVAGRPTGVGGGVKLGRFRSISLSRGPAALSARSPHVRCRRWPLHACRAERTGDDEDGHVSSGPHGAKPKARQSLL